MLRLHLAKKSTERFSVLCLGAHADDIEIGCGGTILRLIEEFPQAAFSWVVMCSNEKRSLEAKISAGMFLRRVKDKTIVVNKFRDGFLPYIGPEVKQYFEHLKHEFSPDIIFTHYRHDLHQDHRLVSELTWNTFRNHLILEYEIPKYDGDLGSPNFFVPLNARHVRRKIDNLLKAFPSQNGKHWFDTETFTSLLRLRGMESSAPQKYAEGFYCRKTVFSPPHR